MKRPTLDEIFAEPDAYGLLEVKPAAAGARPGDRSFAGLAEVTAFRERHGRLPDADARDHDEMRLGTILDRLRRSPSPELLAADRLSILTEQPRPATRATDWRQAPAAGDVPASLDDIFAEGEIEVDETAFTLHHATPAADRHTPDHRAGSVPCRDFETFRQRFEDMQAALEAGDRQAIPVRKWAVIEPQEGDCFIRGGLLALIVEKSEMSARGGSRDHRLRVVFSNGTESDPLMSSFRKSLNDDKTARVVERVGVGPLDPDWDSDRLDLSGTIYVARSLSDEPEIAAQRMILHKIGVTSQDVHRRVADARNDPTFLLAPVEIIAVYALANLPRRKVEELLHRFFEAARPGKLFVTDRFGKKVFPREWFYVLPDHVGQAAKLIQDGTLHLHRYDPLTQAIVRK